jgi:hypothetical protein
MAGPFVRDTNAAELFTAAVDLDTAGTTTGAAVEVNSPGQVVIEIDTATVTSTGNTATLTVNVEQSDVSNFATKTEVGNFAILTGTDAAQSDKIARLKTRVDKRYARVVVTLGGTAPVYTGTTCKVHPRHNRDTKSTDSAGIG